MRIKKNILVIFLIVMMVIAGGCKSSNNLLNESTDTAGNVDVNSSVDIGAICEEVGLNRNVGKSKLDVAEAIADASISADEDTVNVSTEQVATEESVVEEGNDEVIMETATEVQTETTAPAESTQPAEDIQLSTEAPSSTEPETIVSQPIEPESIKPDTPEPIIYDPYQVVNLVIAKCQVGGMITTEDNLANLLAEGKITQTEYDEYYPLDGLEGSYYSVFVETDLNIASDIVGNKLGSVDAIADHIAGMLLLETHPIFNVTYAGIYTHNGVDFYEFRCHR